MPLWIQLAEKYAVKGENEQMNKPMNARASENGEVEEK
jgi:hypothetical protein